MTSPVDALKDWDLRRMGWRATAWYLLAAWPFSGAAIACGAFLPLHAIGGPDETTEVLGGLWLFGLMLVLIGLHVLVPTTVSWWCRVRASWAYRRDPVRWLATAESATRLTLRWVGVYGPWGLETGAGVPRVATTVNRFLVGMWAAGIATAIVTITVIKAG